MEKRQIILERVTRERAISVPQNRTVGKLEDSSSVHEVERILDKRVNEGSLEYLVKWEGYTMRSNTWVAQQRLACL